MVLNKKDAELVVLGDGGWGTTIAIHMAKLGHPVCVWGAFSDHLAELTHTRENRKFLPGFHIPESIRFEPDLNAALANAALVMVAVPSRFFRSVLRRVKRPKNRRMALAILTKGFEPKSDRLMTDVVAEELGRIPVGVVSGPCISREVAQGEPASMVAASARAEVRRGIRRSLDNHTLTILESTDVVGVQVGAAIKNVIAIAAGVVDGLGFGTNTKSILVARGIAEMARLGEKMGARRRTFMGLSGLGDLVTTSFSIHSRNHGCGFEIARGASLTDVRRKTEMVIEGAETARSALRMARRHRIRMPIVEAVNQILYGGRDPRRVIDALLSKSIRNEHE
ncbi:MAG: NAD(P)-dependent glycerol-3-phosphate dehydrogenase [Candidatus Omnitrophica bacterium]|nr:NAD(P)-dependent glycerol-3-phosphate dehydrogenase [Candidatus Omnitrophota bacterium]